MGLEQSSWHKKDGEGTMARTWERGWMPKMETHTLIFIYFLFFVPVFMSFCVCVFAMCWLCRMLHTGRDGVQTTGVFAVLLLCDYYKARRRVVIQCGSSSSICLRVWVHGTVTFSWEATVSAVLQNLPMYQWSVKKHKKKSCWRPREFILWLTFGVFPFTSNACIE